MLNTVDTTGMRTTSNDIEQMANEYTQQVTALYAVGDELDKMWEGDASDSFKTQLGKDLPRFEALSNVVKQYIEAARDFADKYDKTERDLAEGFKKPR